MRARAGLTVVKLGGSHAFSPHLPDWLAAIAHGAGRIVLVPGGGPFADCVRAAQPVMGFGDSSAHRMALLAMEQYGHALMALDARLAPADGIAAIRRGLRARRVPVWLPCRMAMAAPDIPASWDVTSDSLAAWLARRIGATRLYLVKHVDCPPASVDVDDLRLNGVIDPALRGFLAGSGIAAAILGPADHAAASHAFAAGGGVGSRIAVD